MSRTWASEIASGSSGSLLPIPAALSEVWLHAAGVIVVVGEERQAVGYVVATVAVTAPNKKKRMCDISEC